MNIAANPISKQRMQRSVGAGRLSTKMRDGRTHLDRLYQQGCAKIRLPKAYHSTALEAVMINTSGGVTGGDRMNWEFEVADNGHLMVTTQACEKIYKSSDDVARQAVRLKAGSKARLAWLPQETILFDRSAFNRSIEIDIAGDAEALILEPLLIGRQTHGEIVQTASFADQWRVRRGGRLVHAEAFRLDGDLPDTLDQPAVSNGQLAMATLLFVSDQVEAVEQQARALLGDVSGLSVWDGKLLARILAKDGLTLRRRLLPLVRLLNFGAELPKVWSL